MSAAAHDLGMTYYPDTSSTFISFLLFVLSRQGDLSGLARSSKLIPRVVYLESDSIAQMQCK